MSVNKCPNGCDIRPPRPYSVLFGENFPPLSGNSTLNVTGNDAGNTLAQYALASVRLATVFTK